MFTLYTYGDVTMFYNVLNAVAMVFNSSIFNPASGAGAFLVGGLISLIFITSQTIFHPGSSAGFRPAYLLSLFLFFFAGVNIKMTVQLEDVFTGTVSAVSNVPLFVAAPAGIISAAAHGITDSIETAFTVPAPASSFSSISLGAEGFENPLRLLMAIRCNSGSSLAEGNCPAKSFPYVTRSLQLFLLYCAQPNSGFSQTAFETAPDIIGYLTSLPVAGLTTYYSSTYPQGIGMDCSTASTTISTDVSGLFSGSNLQQIDHIVYQNMIASEPGQSNPAAWGMWGTSDITYSFSAIMNGSASQMAAQSAQAYMTNQMFADSLDNTFKCSSSAGSINTFNICVDSITQRNALERMKVDDSASGSIFARTMFPAMNLLLMLFLGFSPLVALVAMMRMGDGSGFKVIGSYLLFGAWTQSWTPVAAIINYYMQMLAGQAAHAAGMTAAGLTIQNEHMFYDALGLKIALGANMLAATPMLTMALLSGSMIAMTSTVSAISGKDKVDESLAAPSLASGNAVTQVGAATSYKAAHEGSANSPGMVSDTGKASVSYSAGNAAKHAESYALSEKTAASENFTKALGAVVNASGSRDASLSDGENFMKMAQNQNADLATRAQSEAEVYGEKHNYTKAQKATLASELYLKGGGSLGGDVSGKGSIGGDGNGKGGAAIRANAKGSVDAGGSVKQDVGDSTSNSSAVDLNHQTDDKAGTGTNKTSSQGISADNTNGLGHKTTAGISKTLSKNLTDAASRLDSAEKNYNETISKETGINTNETFDGMQGGRFMADNNAFAADTNSRYQEAMTDSNPATAKFLRDREQAYERSMNVSNISSPEARGAAVAWAKHLALSNSGNNQLSGEASVAMLNAIGGQGTNPNQLQDTQGIEKKVEDSGEIMNEVATGTAGVNQATAAAQKLGIGTSGMAHIDKAGHLVLDNNKAANSLVVPTDGSVSGAAHDTRNDSGVGGPDGAKNIERYNALVDQLGAQQFAMTGAAAMDFFQKAGYSPNEAAKFLTPLVNQGNGAAADQQAADVAQQKFDSGSLLGVVLQDLFPGHTPSAPKPGYHGGPGGR